MGWEDYGKIETPAGWAAFQLECGTRDDGRHVAHKAMQQSRVRWKIVKIELHDESYATALIRSSNFPIFHPGFCIFSARERGLPSAFGRAPVNAFDQHRELCWRERYRAARLAQRGPDEPAFAAVACDSARNAGLSAASAQLVRITHPFHPFAGRQLACVGER